MLKLAAEKGIPSVLDVDISMSCACECSDTALGSELEFIECLKNASVVKLSLSEAQNILHYFFPLSDYSLESPNIDSLMYISNSLYEKLTLAKMLIVTMGKQGSILTSNVGSVFVPSLSDKSVVVDTTGAGDAYLGGVIAGLYHFGYPESESSLLSLGQLASRCASLCCSVVGGLAPLQVDMQSFLVDLEEAVLPKSDGKRETF